MDQETTREIATKFIHAVNALYGALDDELSDEHAARVVGGIGQHLVHAELGREPDADELDAAMAAMQKAILLYEQHGG